MKRFSLLGLAAAFALGLSMQLASAAEPPAGATNAPAKQADQQTVFKSSTIVGMNVKNSLNETVGSINELVLDTATGNIRYAALSVGGFLGIGDKLFAVPWESLKMKHEGKDRYFFLDVDKEKMKNAPGFAQDNWPDFANPKFGEDIDRYYGVHRVARPVDRTNDTTVPKR
jgi:sporulation protein YlmC with PRC-barrel domain